MRLDDGTRIHLADIRMPGLPVFFGYIQTPGPEPAATAVHPVTALAVTEELGEHGFPTSARIEIAAAPAHDTSGSTSPRSPSGPSSCATTAIPPAPGQPLPPAMVTCRTDDGRTGSGWIEWNQPGAPS